MLYGLTYNVHFGQKIDRITDWLSHISPPFDIICFQEFPFDYLENFLRSPFAKKYESSNALSFNHKKKAYGQITLINKQKMQLLQGETLFLGTSFLEEHMLDVRGGRSALLTKLRYKNTSFIVVNAHLVAYGSNRQRRAQITQIVKHTEDRYKNMPIVLLGDFNYSSLIGQKRLIEFMQAYKFKNAYQLNTHKLLNIKDHQIDYLFSKYIHIEHIQVHNLPFSDHRPITFTLEFLREDK